MTGRERMLHRVNAAGPLLLLVAVTAAFLAVAVWWALTDARLPNGDNGKHLTIAFGYHDLLLDGTFKRVFTDYNLYPPFVHMVGALGAILFEPDVPTALITENVVFVPMLAAGCYGVGTLAFGRWAGALAAILALASPMVIGLFHAFMLDAPTAALVAVTVWALLASERFSRLGLATVAGIAAAAGVYAKSTFPLFIAGLVLVMLLRGGWRNWRGALAFAGTAAVLAGPWYLYHRHIIWGQTEGAVAGQQPFWYNDVPYPERFSFDNFTWYGWNLINNQLYLPLTLFFVAGVGYFAWRWARHRSPDSVVPELLAGAVVAYGGISMITLDDPRYTLPMLVYIAVLGAGWIPRLPTPAAVAAAGVLVAVFAVNILQVNWGIPGWSERIRLPGYLESPIGEKILTVWGGGYGDGKPDSDASEPVVDMLQRAHDAGARRVVFHGESLNSGGYNLNGLIVLARSAGLEVLGFYPGLIQEPTDIYIWRQAYRQVPFPPCLISPMVEDETALFIRWGPDDRDVRCPR